MRTTKLNSSCNQRKHVAVDSKMVEAGGGKVGYDEEGNRVMKSAIKRLNS